MSIGLAEKLNQLGCTVGQINLPEVIDAQSLWQWPQGWTRADDELAGVDPNAQVKPIIFIDEDVAEGFAANACVLAFAVRGKVDPGTLFDDVVEQAPPGTTPISTAAQTLAVQPNGSTTRYESVFRVPGENGELELRSVNVYDVLTTAMPDEYLLLQRTLTARADGEGQLPEFNTVLPPA